MDVLRTYAAGQLVHLLEDATQAPLEPDRVWVDRRAALGLLDTILEVRESPTCGRLEPPRGPLASAAEQIRFVLGDASPVPFTHRVGLATDLAAELARGLRAARG